MIRVLVFLAFALCAGFIAVWVADQSGAISVVLGDTRYETTLGVGLAGLVITATALGILWAVLRFITRGPDALSGFMRNRRRAKGLEAVARALVAVGIGDERSARRAVRDARRLVPGNSLVQIVAAQSAQLSGDRNAAETAFRAMLGDDGTRALGLRGLFIEAHRRGDAAAARDLADEAIRTTPDAPWAGHALLNFHCAEGNWAAALSTVERNASNRIIDRIAARRQRAVLLTAQAQERADRPEEDALTPALEAVKLAPDLIPAAVIAARLLAESGDARRAMRIVETTWKTTPHPDLAEVYLRARHGDTAQDRLKKARNLAARHESHPEGALALARAALDAREFTLARTTLKPLIEAGPTVRTCLLMAEIEDVDQGSRAVARGWLARAVTARRDPAWISDGVSLPVWTPVSPISGELDTVHWGMPHDALPHAWPAAEIIARDTEQSEIIEALHVPDHTRPEQIGKPAATAPASERDNSAPPSGRFSDISPVDMPLPPPPDDPGTQGDPLADEGAPAASRAPAFGPP